MASVRHRLVSTPVAALRINISKQQSFSAIGLAAEPPSILRFQSCPNLSQETVLALEKQCEFEGEAATA